MNQAKRLLKQTSMRMSQQIRMPAFRPTHSDKEIWHIVAFLKNKLVNMSPDEYKQWKQQYPSDHRE